MILNKKHYEIAGNFKYPATKFVWALKMLPWIRSQVARIYILTRREMISFQFYLSLIVDESRYKTNCNFETAIPHYTDGAGRNMLRIGWSRVFSPN